MSQRHRPDIDQTTRIIKAITGKKVLEIGGLGDFSDTVERDLSTWQHAIVKQHAASVVGIDINKEYLHVAQQHGFNYQYGDIEEKDTLPVERYEVILMVDVIEHLNNVGKALANIKELLTDDGIAIITTPSPWACNNLIRTFIGKPPHVFYDHTNYMVKEHFIQLAQRYDLTVRDIDYFTMRDTRSWRHVVGSHIIKVAGAINPIMRSNIWVELSR